MIVSVECEGPAVGIHWGNQWTGDAPVYGSDAESVTPRGPLYEVFLYWKSKRGSRHAPSRGDIDPIDLAANLKHVILIEPLSDGDYFYRVVGTAIVDTIGFEPTQQRLSTLGAYLDEGRVRSDFDDLVAAFQPRYDFGRSPWQGQHWRVYHRLLMPLSDDGERVSHIFGCIDAEVGYSDLLR